jgi:fatty acid desaturase
MRYLLAVLAPPASVCRLGCHTAPPIAVFWIAALAALALIPAWTAGWLSLAGFFWLAATTWAVLTLWGAEADARAVPESSRRRHADPERRYPGEAEVPVKE